MTVLLRLLPLLVVGCLLLQSLQLTAARDCNSNEKNAANNRLTTTFSNCPANHAHWTEHMPFDYDDRAAVTNINNLKRLCQDGYVIRYSTERRTPLFTAERLDGTVLSTQTPATRIDCFRRDPRLTIDAESSSMNAYNTIRSSDYTKGHIAPAGDMVTDIPKKNTFILSNMAPQYQIHNNGPWSDWEQYTRQRAKEEGVLFVITGVTGQLASYPRFIVPRYFYKILVWCENGVIEAEYIHSLHSNVALPATQWQTTSTKALSQAANAIPTVAATTRTTGRTVVQVETDISTNTRIIFRIGASNICPRRFPTFGAISWFIAI